MKNKIEDLRNHLFAQLERLGDDDLKGDALTQEVARANAIQGVAAQIISSARVEVTFLQQVGGKGTGFIPKTFAPSAASPDTSRTRKTSSS